jgi:3D (Asp-Asp-Asp) domain-containing protein
MTKKSCNLYFKGEPKNVKKVIQDLAEIFSSTTKIVIEDLKHNKLTLISIGDSLLHYTLDLYFDTRTKTVDVFIDEFRVERY